MLLHVSIGTMHETPYVLGLPSTCCNCPRSNMGRAGQVSSHALLGITGPAAQHSMSSCDLLGHAPCAARPLKIGCCVLPLAPLGRGIWQGGPRASSARAHHASCNVRIVKTGRSNTQVCYPRQARQGPLQGAYWDAPAASPSSSAQLLRDSLVATPHNCSLPETQQQLHMPELPKWTALMHHADSNSCCHQ
jgi:hypothetical protein